MATFAPYSAKRTAIAWPIPELPPVTSTFLPWSPRMRPQSCRRRRRYVTSRWPARTRRHDRPDALRARTDVRPPRRLPPHRRLRPAGRLHLRGPRRPLRVDRLAVPAPLRQRGGVLAAARPVRRALVDHAG